ncbi:MAG: hypothetical protein AB8G05_05515 [Oligoflexales bacterium]
MDQTFQGLSNELYAIRGGFATWLATRRMFVTLATFSQARIVISEEIDSLAAIYTREQITIYLHPVVVAHYQEDHQACYFLLMHELRHLTQVRGTYDWSKLVNCKPLTSALLDILPPGIARKYGITDINTDLEYKHHIFNLAADAAIHEDIVRLFERNIFSRVGRLTKLHRGESEAKADEEAADVEPVTVDFLEKIVGTPLERGQDWVYYARAMIQSLAQRVRKEPQLAQLIVDRQILRKISGSAPAEHLLHDDELAAIDRSLMRAEGESKKMIEAQLEAHNSDVPCLEGDDFSETHQARKEVNKAIQKILQIVKNTITAAQVKHPKIRRSYHRPHMFVADAPGRMLTRSRDKKSSSVLVVDTSGSMWMPLIMENMASLAFHMMKRRLIEHAFCCDVELYPIENIASGSVTLMGCGGTAWTTEHNSEILSYLYGNELPKEPLTIYYCTDEEVYGLEEAIADQRVNLVIINLPQLIDEQTYMRAKV